MGRVEHVDLVSQRLAHLAVQRVAEIDHAEFVLLRAYSLIGEANIGAVQDCVDFGRKAGTAGVPLSDKVEQLTLGLIRACDMQIGGGRQKSVEIAIDIVGANCPAAFFQDRGNFGAQHGQGAFRDEEDRVFRLACSPETARDLAPKLRLAWREGNGEIDPFAKLGRNQFNQLMGAHEGAAQREVPVAANEDDSWSDFSHVATIG